MTRFVSLFMPQFVSAAVLSFGIASVGFGQDAAGKQAPVDCPSSYQPLNDITCIDAGGERVVFVVSQGKWYKFFPGSMMDGVGIAAPLDAQDQQVYVAASDLSPVAGWNSKLQSVHPDTRVDGTIFFPVARGYAVFHECPTGYSSDIRYPGTCTDAKGNGVAYLKATGQSGKVVATNSTDVLLDFGKASPFSANPFWVQADDLATPNLLSMGRSGTKLRYTCPAGYTPNGKLYCMAPDGVSYLYLAPSGEPLAFIQVGGDAGGEILVERPGSRFRFWIPADRFAEIVAKP